MQKENLNKIIGKVELLGGHLGFRLKVYIPLGMTGPQLMEWKRNNQAEIDRCTNLEEIESIAA